MRHALNGPTPTALLDTQTESAQHLARSSLTIVDTLNAQPMYHSPEIRAVYARVRQLAYLATDAADAADAADHLIDAVDILDHTRAGLPIELGDDFLAVLTEQEARQEAGQRFTLVASLTALGSADALTTAELFVAERRHRGSYPSINPLPFLTLRAPRCARWSGAMLRSPTTSPVCAARTSASASAPSALWRAAAW